MSDLLTIIPTRGRPHVIMSLWESFVNNSQASDLILALDDDDPTLSEYMLIAEKCSIDVRVGQRLRLGGTLNSVALEYCDKYLYLGFMGDDHRPRTLGWDVNYTEALQSNLFVYGNDLLQSENLPTQIAMSSSVVKTLGYMSPPILIHMFIDNAWKAWGDGTGSMKYLPNVVVEHLHPAAGKASTDTRYDEVWAYMDPDSKKWQEYNDSGDLESDIDKLRGLL